LLGQPLEQALNGHQARRLRGFREGLPRFRVDSFIELALEFASLLDMKLFEITITGALLEGRDTCRDLVYRGLRHSVGFDEIQVILAFDPLIVGMMLAHGISTHQASYHSQRARGSILLLARSIRFGDQGT
jgi:hypothetical protein